MMKRMFGAAAIGLLLASLPQGAQAAEGQDAEGNALAQCFVLKTTGEDRLMVARWVLGALASSPQVTDLVTVDAARKDAADQGIARLFTRLITVDCATLAAPLMKTRGQEAFRLAGGALGQIAVQELMSNRSAAAAMGAFTRYLREEDFKPLKP